MPAHNIRRVPILLTLLILASVWAPAGEPRRVAASGEVESVQLTRVPDSQPRDILKEIRKEEQTAAREDRVLRARAQMGTGGVPLKTTAFTLTSTGLWWYEASPGTMYVMGELVNTGSSTASFVRVTLNFRNSSGQVIASEDSFIWGTCLKLSAVQTGTCLKRLEVGFFGMYVDVNPNQVASFTYSVDAEYYPTYPPNANVALDGTLYQSPWGWNEDKLRLTGDLRNSGTVASTFTIVAILVKTTNDEFLDIEWGFVDGSYINGSDTGIWPNRTAPFELLTDAPKLFQTYLDFSLRYDWTDYGTPPSTPTPTPTPTATPTPSPTPTPTPTPPSCTFEVRPLTIPMDHTGGNGIISVTTQPGCSWTARVSKLWVTLPVGNSRVGSAPLPFHVDPNSGDEREALITVIEANQACLIKQAGYPETPRVRGTNNPGRVVPTP